MSKKLNLLFLGPQGSGKGTQAEILAKKYKLANISAGQVLRERGEVADDLGQLIKKVTNKGELISLDIYKQVIIEKLKKINNPNGVILDGVIRNLDQADALKDVWAKVGLNEPWVIFLDISEEESFKRLKLRKREDDNDQAIKERLSLYHQKTEPVLELFRKKGKLIKINGMPDIKTIALNIEKVLKQRKII